MTQNINCQNYLCIYEHEGKCKLNNIELDVLGQCTECMYPNIDKTELNRLKLKTLLKLEESYNNT